MKKQLKPFLQLHNTGKDAVNRTTKNNVIAVVVKTFIDEQETECNFYSYKTNADFYDTNLRDDFPLTLGSNQTIQEIDGNDY